MIAHKKTGRSLHAAALASALVLALAALSAVPADAAADVPKPSVAGTIKATTITMTVPTQVAVYIDPDAEQSTDATGWPDDVKIGQYTNPTNFVIANHSTVDVYGYVSEVTASGVTLTNDKSSLSKPGGVAPAPGNAARINVMMGLCGADETLNLDATDGGYAGLNAGWLTVDGVGDQPNTRYYAFNKNEHGRLAAVQDGVEDPASACTITVRGAVFGSGWSRNESFLVTPVFTIKATDPSAAA